jgi:hypothetical protein
LKPLVETQVEAPAEEAAAIETAAPKAEPEAPSKPLDPEAVRRAAHIAAEKEAEARRLEQKAKEEARAALEAEEKAKQAQIEKVKAAKADASKDGDDKPGSRKDKRDRKEIDIDEIQQKKAKHGIEKNASKNCSLKRSMKS